MTVGPGLAESEVANEVAHLKWLLQKEIQLRERAEEEIKYLKSQNISNGNGETTQNNEILRLGKRLDDEVKQRNKLQEEIKSLKFQLNQNRIETDETRMAVEGELAKKFVSNTPTNVQKTHQVRDAMNGQKATVVGLQKTLSLLESEDVNVRIHAVKVVANLAAEVCSTSSPVLTNWCCHVSISLSRDAILWTYHVAWDSGHHPCLALFPTNDIPLDNCFSIDENIKVWSNQEKIVEAGGLTSLLMLLRKSEHETIQRVAAGAIANLAMNETNQDLIMAQGGISLLSKTADVAEDYQTLRMVAGAIANLCGNGILSVIFIPE
eukprot:Gb_23031 [translate_table: standard]